MQIPILSGLYADTEYRTAYPLNMIPVPKENGISKGYLRPAEGIIQSGTGPGGADRGGITWNGIVYRVLGESLCSIDPGGGCTVLGNIAGSGMCSLDYSFDLLAIAGGGNLYYWNGSTLTQVTDPDLGPVVDMQWIAGYFMTTDGTSLIVTELNDPTSVNPLKYGSSEADPDGIKAVGKLRNEAYAFNRYTTEVFQNIGGNLFPFQVIEGALIPRGSIGTHTVCEFLEAFAFVGSGRNESPSVWLAQAGSTTRLASREIDTVLQTYTADELAASVLEARVDKGHRWLYLHLPRGTWVHDAAASVIVGEPVWFELGSAVSGSGQYRARSLLWAYDKWQCADPTSGAYGYLTTTLGSHYTAVIGWQFQTLAIYTGGQSCVVHDEELVGITGNAALGDDPTVWHSSSIDGKSWSQERPCSAGKQGDVVQNVAWRKTGRFRQQRIERFRGTSDAMFTVAALEMSLEVLGGNTTGR